MSLDPLLKEVEIQIAAGHIGFRSDIHHRGAVSYRCSDCQSGAT
jgi:hypothetical protein